MVTNRRHVYPVELPTYRKPIPLVLFHTINVGVQTDEVSSKNVQVSRISFVDNFCQISVDVVDSSVQTSEWSPDVVIVPTLKPLQRYQLTTSMFVQPKGFSPMATLLTPMGNAFLLLFLQAQNLRKKASRIEDDNESLVLQLKKMATKARSTNYIYI